MLLVGRVAERDVVQIEVGGSARGTLIDGTTVEGRVTFVGRQSDAATRTYPIEVEVANADYRLRSGITTEILIPVRTLPAHRVSSSLLALDDVGRVGVRTVDREGRVEFHAVDILAEEAGAVWVAGLPEVTTLITVGQELVVPRQRVEVDYEPAAALPASTPTTPTAVPEARVRRPTNDTSALSLAGADAAPT
jgi:multidrug efflux system membrane fusion protein